MSDHEQKMEPNPRPGIFHEFECTDEKTLCDCWAKQLVRYRNRVAQLEACLADVVKTLEANGVTQ